MGKSRHLFTGKSLSGNFIYLADEEYKHLRARRIKTNEKILVYFENAVYECELVSIKETRARISSKVKDITPSIQICIACPLPKGKKKSILIEKITEIGITDYIPLNTARTTFTVDDHSIERMNKISLEAFKQSHGAPIKIHKTMTSEEAIEFSAKFATKLLLEPSAPSKLIDALKASSDIICIIGPEGGFTETEISSFKDAGFAPISLSTNILKIETCAIYVASLLKELSGTKSGTHT